MILSINIHDKNLICLETTNIRTMTIINSCINVTMYSKFGVDDLKIYTDSADECQRIFDRIIYCITTPMLALNSSKNYLRIGCDDTEESSDD